MDDTACAAALLLAVAGEASLSTGSRELVTLAGELEQAADAVSAPCTGLAAVVRMLSGADSYDVKLKAVKSLEEAATLLKEAAAALRHGAENLLRARATGPPNAPSDLPMARDTFERARQHLLGAVALASSAERLVLACQEYRHVADAILLVRHAAAEAEAERARHAAAEAEAERARHAAAEAERALQQRRDSTDAATTRQQAHTGRWWSSRWWSCLWRSRSAKHPDIQERSDIEDPLIRKADPRTPSPSATSSIDLGSHGQGDEKRSGMMGYGLFGSIGLIPYLGPDKVAKKVELLSDNGKLVLHVSVCVWWTLVALGAPCSAYTQSLFERICALLSSRLGILGMNIVVILFMYCILDIDYERTLYWVLGGVSAPHVVLFVTACRRRHF